MYEQEILRKQLNKNKAAKSSQILLIICILLVMKLQ